jgi:SAM-dependent methyltransferase
MASSGQNYHLEELRIAQDPADSRRIIPEIPPRCKAILDAGCGAGQTLLGLSANAEIALYGIDIDAEALALGKQLSDRIVFEHASAENIPFPADFFDLLICRTSLQYMDVRKGIGEFARVLSPEGTLWITLLPLRRVLQRLGAGIRHWRPKEVAFCLYSLFHGLWFGATGRQFCVAGRSELFHVRWRIRRELRRAGFQRISIDHRARHYIVVAHFR